MNDRKPSTLRRTVLFTGAVVLLVVINGIMVSGKFSTAAGVILLVAAILVAREAFFRR